MNHPVILTFDVDRDWPVEKTGRMEAISGIKPDTPDDPSVHATTRGLDFILDLLEEMDYRATFFLEASVLTKLPSDIISRLSKHDIGCHGYAHEDFLGLGTSYTPTLEERWEALKLAHSIISKELRPPLGFRAPYLRWDSELLRQIRELGFQYDSSHTIRQATALSSYTTEELIEVPLSTGRDDKNNVISGYLWQLHEGNRKIEDYLHFIERQAVLPNIRYSMLATHPWHLFLSTVSRTYLEGKELARNLESFKRLVERLGEDITAVDNYLTHLS